MLSIQIHSLDLSLTDFLDWTSWSEFQWHTWVDTRVCLLPWPSFTLTQAHKSLNVGAPVIVRSHSIEATHLCSITFSHQLSIMSLIQKFGLIHDLLWILSQAFQAMRSHLSTLRSESLFLISLSMSMIPLLFLLTPEIESEDKLENYRPYSSIISRCYGRLEPQMSLSKKQFIAPMIIKHAMRQDPFLLSSTWAPTLPTLPEVSISRPQVTALIMRTLLLLLMD